MELLLSYALNQNNGLSPIENIERITGNGWGVPCVSHDNATVKRLIIPMINDKFQWVIFSYTYNTDVNKWIYHQLLLTNIYTNMDYIYTSVTDTHLFLLDNTTRTCFIYTLDGDQRWALAQTIFVPNTPREIGTAQSGSLLTIQLASSSIGDYDGYYVGWTCRITGGTGVIGEERIITNYQESNQMADIAVPWTTAPDNTTTYELFFNSQSERISACGTYLAISDWAYLNISSTFGVVIMYKLNSITGNFELDKYIPSPAMGNNKFGSSIALRDDYLIVGAYDKTNSLQNDGSVYVYEYNLMWPVTPTTELFAPVPDTGAYFGFSVDAYTDGGSQDRILVGAPGYNISRGTAIFFKKTTIWELENAVNAIPASNPGDAYGSYVSIWNNQAAVSAINENGGEGAVYIYKEQTGLIPDPCWIFVARQDAPGSVGYGIFTCLTPNKLVTVVFNGDVLLSVYNGVSWQPATILTYLTQTKLVVNYAKSIYHSTDNNTILNLKLTYPISGNFLMSLDIKNNIKTIGNQNNVIYFYEDGVGYLQAIMPSGNYTGVDLATMATNVMNAAGTLTYTINWENSIQKLSAQATGLFCFGSNMNNSYYNSCQDKVMGFFVNSYMPLQTYFLADRETILTAPNKLGVKIKQGFPLVPVQNNNPFAEVGFVCNLASNYYKILESDNQILRIPNKVSELTLTFPCVEGGGLTSINTNDLTLSLLKSA